LGGYASTHRRAASGVDGSLPSEADFGFAALRFAADWSGRGGARSGIARESWHRKSPVRRPPSRCRQYPQAMASGPVAGTHRSIAAIRNRLAHRFDRTRQLGLGHSRRNPSRRCVSRLCVRPHVLERAPIPSWTCRARCRRRLSRGAPRGRQRRRVCRDHGGDERSGTLATTRLAGPCPDKRHALRTLLPLRRLRHDVLRARRDSGRRCARRGRAPRLGETFSVGRHGNRRETALYVASVTLTSTRGSSSMERATTKRTTASTLTRNVQAIAAPLIPSVRIKYSTDAT